MWNLRLTSLVLLGIFSISVSGGRHNFGLGPAFRLRNALRGGRPRADAYSFYSSGKTGRASKLVMTPAGDEQSVFQGDKFFVSCSSDATNVLRVMWTGPEGRQITSYAGSVALNEIPRIYIEDGRAGHKGIDLVFENITRKDRGQYTCSANVDGNEESVSFQLFVYKYIDFDDTPPVQYLEENGESTLRCDVDGDPSPDVSWVAKGKRVPPYGNKYRKDPDNANNLIVQNVTIEDAGNYTCKALQLSARTSNFQDMVIEVKVHHKPHSSDDFTDQAFSYVSGIVNLTCDAVAEPKANFSWMKDDQLILPSDTVKIINFPNKSILQLTVQSPDMFGDYECVAENRLGTLERVIILQMGSKPAKPTIQITQSDVNALHLSLDATNHPEMPILGFRVQYKKAGDDWSSAHVTEFRKGEAYTINSLSDDTLYVLRAFAKNAAGLSDYSEEVMERTKKVEALMNQTSSSSYILSSFTTFSSLILALLVFL